MGIFTHLIPQNEFRQFLRRVDFLKTKGITIDYQASQRNKRMVKIIMHKAYDWEELDRICEEM